MVLSDGTIRERIEQESIVVDPYEPDNVEPASIDLRLSDSFSKIISTGVIDTRNPESIEYNDFHVDSLILNPGETILGSTMERVEIPNDLSARVVGRSSLGRLFVEVHKTAGFGDPGFKGDITLEIGNDSDNPVRLYQGQRICQIIFEELDKPAERPYGHERSQYQDQTGATNSGMDFE